MFCGNNDSNYSSVNRNSNVDDKTDDLDDVNDLHDKNKNNNGFESHSGVTWDDRSDGYEKRNEKRNDGSYSDDEQNWRQDKRDNGGRSRSVS